MSKNQIEKKYDCKIFKDRGFDDKRAYWVALGKSENSSFDYADGWTLPELERNIKKEITGGN